jgi:hypothetical protein
MVVVVTINLDSIRDSDFQAINFPMNSPLQEEEVSSLKDELRTAAATPFRIPSVGRGQDNSSTIIMMSSGRVCFLN